jgi:Concanavalin A-like lectin/glucanases superfamily
MCKRLTCFMVLGLVIGIGVSSAQARLVHHWKFDEDTAAGATVAADSVGSLDGVIDGATSVPGKAGNALSFDGADDVVTIDKFVPPQQGTIVFWTNPALTKSKERILGAGGDYEVWLRSNGELKNELFDNGSATVGTGAGALAADEWNHVATTYDSATTVVEIYLDGELRASGRAQVPSTPTETTLLLGHRAGAAAGEHYGGLLDDVRIYDSVLSGSEIKKLANPLRTRARDPIPPDGAIFEDTWANLSWTAGDFAVSHDVYLGDNFDEVNNAASDSNTFRGNQTETFFVAGFPGYPYPDGLVPGTTYYWRIDEVNDAEPNSPWKGDVWSFSIPPKKAYDPNPANGAESVAVDAKLTWTAGFGAKLHTVYFGDDFDTVANAAGGLAQGTASYTPSGLEMAKTYYWRVDEFDGTATYTGDVWSFTTQGAVGNPNPANDAVGVNPTPILTWSVGVYAASHEVYFGDDADAVKNAAKSSPEYKGPKALGDESYEPGKLAWETTYYWRIDEVNAVNPDSPWKGNIWSFTTANFAVIDDFESYDSGASQIWYSWHDGLGYGTPQNPPYFAGNGTGAAVGDETTASYTEETIVHGGSQSMPLAYDNNKQGFAKYSEVELQLTALRDWTADGATQLSLWFRGGAANAPERLYVAIANSAGQPAVVYHDDANAAKQASWTQWVIPLQVFADQGIDLTSVDRIAIGLGTRGNLTTPGGSGTMYFDDIRLSRPQDLSE